MVQSAENRLLQISINSSGRNNFDDRDIPARITWRMRHDDLERLLAGRTSVKLSIITGDLAVGLFLFLTAGKLYVLPNLHPLIPIGLLLERYRWTCS